MSGTISKSKLTLWMDKETTRFGKEWAKQNHESLSQLVADYLTRLKAVAKKPDHLTPLVKKLSGVLKGRGPERASYRKYLEKKYLGA